jgi:hypothetical protein
MPNRIADLGHKYGVTFLTDEKLASIWSMLDVENKGFVTLDDLAARSANKQVRGLTAQMSNFTLSFFSLRARRTSRFEGSKF